MYRGGELVYASAGCAAHFRYALTRGMALYYGQGSDSYAGGFKHAKALNGMLDEIRHWGYARTQQQIRDSMNVALDVSVGAIGPGTLHATPSLSVCVVCSQRVVWWWSVSPDNLNYYYSLDSTFYEPVLRVNSVPDLSGNGNAGRLGWLPNAGQVLIYIDNSPAHGPTEPKRVHSRAPIAGAAPLRVFLDPSASGAQTPVAVELTAHDPSVLCRRPASLIPCVVLTIAVCWLVGG